MATVEFECPKCGQICAFQDRFVGRRARCTKCSSYFFIPAAGQSARLLKPVLTADGPWSGFWTAFFAQTPKALLDPDSVVAIIILILFSLLRFFFGHPLFVVQVPFLLFMLPVPVGIFVTVLTSLSQCRYLFQLIQSTTDQHDPLPNYLEGTYIDRFFDGIVCGYTFVTLLAVFLSAAGVIFWALKKAAIDALWPVFSAAAVGLLFLPLSVTIYAYSRDLILSFRLDYTITAIRKAFGPYLAVYLPTLAIALLIQQSWFYSYKAPGDALLSSAVFHAAATGLCILAGRGAGLFYRHYGCYLP